MILRYIVGRYVGGQIRERYQITGTLAARERFEDVIEAARGCPEAPGLEAVGLHGVDGQIVLWEVIS